MRIFFTGFLVLMIISFPVRGDETLNNSVLSISIAKYESKNTSIDIKFTNTFDDDIHLMAFTGSLPFGCQFELVLPDGTNGKLLAKHGITVIDGKTVVITLQPRHSTNMVIPLNYYFDMTLPGEYKLKVKKKLIWDHAGITLESNELTIPVTFPESAIEFPENSPEIRSDPSNGCSISVKASKKRFDIDDPVHVRISCKNTSKDRLALNNDTPNLFDVYELKLYLPASSRDFRALGNGEKNKLADLTNYGKILFSEKGKGSADGEVSVKPGEEFSIKEFSLSRVYDMSREGIYGLIVSRKYEDASGKPCVVESPPFPIRIGTAFTSEEMRLLNMESEERK